MSRKIIENPYKCPVTHAMNVIGGKWKPIIIFLLCRGSLRFGKLIMFMPSISRKVLTDQLREMEADGLILREKYAEIPPRVEYSLTENSKKLVPLLFDLGEWAREMAINMEFDTLDKPDYILNLNNSYTFHFFTAVAVKMRGYLINQNTPLRIEYLHSFSGWYPNILSIFA